MKTHIVVLLALVWLWIGAPAQAQFTPWEGASVIEDPEWRKRFLGSYGFLSGAEPQVNAVEVETLREVIDLMKVDPRAASAVLSAKVGPDSSAALDFILANLEFQNGQLETAQSHYQSALEKFPDFRRAHKNLGLLRVQQGNHAEAVTHLSRALELGDRDGRNYGLLGFCHINLEDNLAAEQAYRSAILQQPATRDWKLGLARALLAMEKYKEAVALFDALLADDPDDATSWLLQANAYVGLDQPRAAAVNLETVRLLGKAQPQSLNLLGDIYMNAGMPELATSAYLEVIESDAKGERFDAAYRAAELLLRVRSHDEAGRILDSIDERYAKGLGTEDELRVLTLRAKLARAEGRKREAAKLLEGIVQRDGTRGDALLELAAYYEEQGQREKALLMLERAQRLSAWEYEALLDRAQIMVSARDYPRAAELLREALQLKPEPRVQQFLARVEQAIRS